MSGPSRRGILVSTVTLAAGLTLSRASDLLAQELKPTPECRDGDEPTMRQTEGPFFKPRSPQRSDLREPGAPRPIALSGTVLTRRCRPVPGALVDLWHSDESGDYDNTGFRYRGHQFADTEGRFSFRTIVPAEYPGRTRHYHVKVQAPRGRVLTTQLYFPGEAGNARDFLFKRELLMRTAQGPDGLAARFDFVLDMR